MPVLRGQPACSVASRCANSTLRSSPRFPAASVTTTRTVNAGSFGSASPAPFAGAVGSVVAPPPVRASSAARTAFRSIVPSAPSTGAEALWVLTSRKSPSAGSMPGAHWSLHV